MHFCARGCTCTHTLSLQRMEMFFVTSSAGQEHHLRKKTIFFFTIIPFPNTSSYRAPSPFGNFTSLASKIWTRCRLLWFSYLISPYFVQSLVAAWKDQPRPAPARLASCAFAECRDNLQAKMLLAWRQLATCHPDHGAGQTGGEDL